MFKQSERSLAVRIIMVVFASILFSQTFTLFIFALLMRLKLIIPQANFTVCLAAAFGASCILGTTIAAFLSNRLSEAYEKYKRALREIACGNFDVCVPEDKTALFGQIAHDINLTARELKNNRIMRNDFVSNFSHELKTPIVSINGFAELLMADTVNEDERREYAAIIYQESSRLLNLAKNTLLLSKLEGQAAVFEKKLFRLDESVENAAIMLAKQIKEKNVSLKCDLDKIYYFWDADLFSQVAINLLSNAIKYGGENGVVEVSLKQKEDSVRFSVKDHGIGMDEKTLSRVFERYFQGDGSHKSEGNGLGLSIVDKIVKLCGGKIEVYSKLGAGSEFLVILPMHKPE